MNDRQRNMMRLVMFFAAFALSAVFAGCGGERDVESLRLEIDEQPPLRFGVFPFLERGELEKALSPLMEYLAGRLGREVKINIVADYTDLERLVRQRRIDIGWFSPRSRQGGAQGVMIPICRPRTSAGSYHGVIIAKRDSGVCSLSDLASGSFAYVDRGSKSGFLYPNLLFAEQGIDPLRFFNGIHWAGNHEKCIQGVLDGRWTAAAVTSLVMRTGSASVPVADRLVVVATTAEILTDPIVFREGAAGLDIASISDLFLNIASEQAGRGVIASLSITLGINGFDRISEGDR